MLRGDKAAVIDDLHTVGRAGAGDSIADNGLLAIAVAMIQSPGAWPAREQVAVNQIGGGELVSRFRDFGSPIA
jgi:hypothetical protein